MTVDDWRVYLTRRVAAQFGEARVRADRELIDDAAEALARLDAIRLDSEDVIEPPDEGQP